MTETSKSVTAPVTVKRDTLACARPSYGRGVTVSRYGAKRDVTDGERDKEVIALRAQGLDSGAVAPELDLGIQARDSDSTPARGDAVTVTDGQGLRERQKKALAADPRFAGWVAGSAE